MKNRSARFRRGVWLVATLVLLIAMGLGTKVVSGTELEAAEPKTFSSADFAAAEFPAIQEYIVDNAAPLAEVAAALAADPAAAAAEYGVAQGSSFPVFSVTFTAVAGAVDPAGFVPFVVEGVPADINVRVQTGPAINGTDLRDATGTISFPDFVNQIEYQDAGSALNEELKVQVLADLTAADLAGQTVTVFGAFQLVNPAAFTITPVQIEVG